MEPVRVGIIGCGVIGTHHVAAAVASENVELAAVADLIPERAQKAAEGKPGVAVYGEGHELLADDSVEAVVLAMPAVDRFQLGVDAFAVGKHVLTEKPVARNVAEVDALIAARGNLVGAGCSGRYRFGPSADAATAFLATGALGELRVVRCREIIPAAASWSLPRPPWRISHRLNGGGILANWGVYDLDYLLGLLGWSLKPRLILAGCWGVAPAYDSYAAPGSDAETHVAFLAQCEGGAVLTYERAECAPAEGDAAWEMLGTEGSLRLALRAKEKRLTFTPATAGQAATPEVIWEGEDPRDLIHHGPLADFATAIRTGAPPKTTLEQARVIQQITDAVYESARTGRAVGV